MSYRVMSCSLMVILCAVGAVFSHPIAQGDNGECLNVPNFTESSADQYTDSRQISKISIAFCGIPRNYYSRIIEIQKTLIIISKSNTSSSERE